MTIMQAISRLAFYFRRHHRLVYWQIAACAILTSALSTPVLAANTVVRMVTTLGTIDIELYDDLAPKTVTNFLRYAGLGGYSKFTSTDFVPQGAPATGFIHRRTDINIEGISVIQGGGYAYSDLRNGPIYFSTFVDYFRVPRLAPIPSEFSPALTNARGYIAMALTANPNGTTNPDSATSEWFINQTDNSAALQSGGYTVFGKVNDIASLSVVDAIANLPALNAASPSITCSTRSTSSSGCNLPNAAFYTLPVSNYNPTTGLDPSNLVSTTSIPNVLSTTTILGNLATFTADPDMTFGFAQTFNQTASTTLLQEFTPPPNKTAQFNDGIFRFSITGALGPTGRIVTLRNDDPATANRYYAYGPTTDNASPHWYDFTFDSATGTGAEFVGNKILLHFVDGQRGDSDSINGSVTHTGAPVQVTDIATGSSKSSGCSIAATPSQSTGNGDWIVISLFLAFVAFVRRRTRRDRIQHV